jgi:serine/threonine protein kinase
MSSAELTPSSTTTRNPEVAISSMELGLFDQKYEMGKKIGEGANGLVRLCTHRKKQQVFAVKTMMMDEEHILSLKKNFLTVRALQHPNIIKYRAIYLDMKKHLSYLVMEYLSLPSLDKFVMENECLIPLKVIPFTNLGFKVDFL